MEGKVSLWERSSSAIVNAVMANDALRGTALKVAERRLYRHWIEHHTGPLPLQCRKDRFHLVRNLFHSLNRALSQDRLSPSVRRAILKIFLDGFILNEKDRQAAFVDAYGLKPPGFLVISPGKRCNLRCTGCYAASSAANTERLDYDVLRRIIREKTEFWGSHFTVLSGGEPFMYESRGKGILDLAAEFPDNYFMSYTNGTLITPEVAERIAELGNFTPAISVEGLAAETDARRGKGIFKKIHKAFQTLREAGAPFGVSGTATRYNADLILSDAFIDHYFGEEGAIYYWIFQYMPIGRSYTLDLQVTSEQRLDMYNRMMALIREKNVFIVDFWNSGPATSGCLAGGRHNGYFHIDWNGRVMPCVFFPYSTHNILDVYREGGNLNTTLMSPLFTSIRKWQDEYGYMAPAMQTQNQIAACPMRDHHADALEMIRTYGACPANEEAAAALDDEMYHARLAHYGEEVAALTDPIWEAQYLGKRATEQERKHVV